VSHRRKEKTKDPKIGLFTPSKYVSKIDTGYDILRIIKSNRILSILKNNKNGI